MIKIDDNDKQDFIYEVKKLFLIQYKKAGIKEFINTVELCKDE